LEYGEFIKVGSSKVQKTDVRIVAATNMDLIKAIRNGKFREDLYYRLNTVPAFIPPLRDRKEDIFLLFKKFSIDFAEKYRMPSIQLTDEAKQVLSNYRWPGNIRELKNITERMSIIEQEREISASVLKTYLVNPDIGLPALMQTDPSEKPFFNSEREILYQILFDMRKDINDLKKLVPEWSQNKPAVSDISHISYTSRQVSSNLPEKLIEEEPVPYADEYAEEELKSSEESTTLSLEEVEKEMIKKALERNAGKRRNAASDLKISERTLYRKIKEYDLE
jgi:DNA-binding NtrC family response regulator